MGCKQPVSIEPLSAPLFNLLDQAESGIDFVNEVTPDDSLSFATYAGFNNGGGVALGDINNDGLVDIFFVSNQGDNRLYLNKDEMNFDDITETSGVAGKADWQTGVTMVDINDDGWLDIYVSCVSGLHGTQGHNELYINQGNLTFTEEASLYGLASRDISTHAAFFDYDLDGDLDCYLLTYAGHDANTYESLVAQGRQMETGGDRLLQNREGKFIDVTSRSGIISSYNGFGLGVAISDFNQDGWPDIYVSNDFHEDDFFYLNQGNGTFKEALRAHFGHTSRFSMGSDVADINNDGFMDLITLDMMPPEENIEKSTVGEDPNLITYYKRSFGYYKQVSRNCLQLNLGGQRFVDISGFAGVQATDWSWAPLFADFDLDGKKDLFVSNGVLHRPNDLDFLDFAYQEFRSQQDSGRSSEEILRPTFKDYEKLPDGSYHNFFFKGMGDGRFSDHSEIAGLTFPDVSTGAAYADLDNDGDLDLVCNRLNAPSIVLQNLRNDDQKGSYLTIRLEGMETNRFAVGAEVRVFTNDQMQLQYNMPSRGFQSSVDFRLYFGFDSTVTLLDSLTVSWPNGSKTKLEQVATGQIVDISEKESAPSVRPENPTATLLKEMVSPISFRHKENNFIDFSRDALIPFRMSLEGPALAIGDVNRDNLEDVFIGGAGDQAAELWIQKEDGSFTRSFQPQITEDSIYEDVAAILFDVDRDFDLDLYVVSGGNEFKNQEDRLYINNGGNGNYMKGRLNAPTGNKSCIAAADFDEDGDVDLFIGGRNEIAAYGQIPRSYLLVNDGLGQYTNLADSIGKGLSRLGMVTDAKWSDTDADGDLDLVVVGEFMPVTIFENIAGRLKRCKKLTEIEYSGLFQCVVTEDFDGDGDIDIMAGNLGLNSKLLKTDRSSIRLYSSDFDHNRKIDQILAYEREGKWYPAIVKKSELGKVMPTIFQKRIIKNADFAGKTIEEIFTSEELAEADILEANELASIYLENTGGHTFTSHRLPDEIQYSSVHTLLAQDLNGDSHLDVLVAGNFEGADAYQGPYDASYGWVLLGDGSGNFEVKLPKASGFLVDGQVKSILPIKIGGQTNFMIATNDQALRLFRKLISEPNI